VDAAAARDLHEIREHPPFPSLTLERVETRRVAVIAGATDRMPDDRRVAASRLAAPAAALAGAALARAAFAAVPDAASFAS
jgi:hypothetical protein